MRGISESFIALRELWHDLLALVWPTECVSCGAPDRDLCADCVARVAPIACAREEPDRPPTPYARPQAGSGRVIRGTVPAARRDVPLIAAGPYDGPVRAMIVALKHHGRTGFSRRLGRLLAVPLATALALCESRDRPLLVCVPSRGVRVRRRGYRHVELVVRSALRVLRRARAPGASPPRPGRDFHPRPGRALRPRIGRVLRPLPGRTGQVGLAHGERVRNAQRIAVSRRHASRGAGREAILIDDIVTSGATATAACDALADAGYRVVAVVALAVVERRDTREESLRDARSANEWHAHERKEYGFRKA